MENIFLKVMDYEYMSALTRQLAKNSRVTVEDFGCSVQGRALPVIKMGEGARQVLFVGTVHATEWITAAMLLRFCFDLLSAASGSLHYAGYSALSALRRTTLHVIPMLNPDGVQLSLYGADERDENYNKLVFFNNYSSDFSCWQSNRNGVDLNHNFDAGFFMGKKLEQNMGVYGPSPSRYGGQNPFCEPETAAVKSYIESRYFERVYAFHSQGEEIYCDYNGSIPEGGADIAQILSKVSGYRLSKPGGIAAYRGLKDWFIEKYNRPAFTVEIGKGENPLPLSQFASVYRKVSPLLILSAIL